MATPFNIVIRGMEPGSERAFQTLLNHLNSQRFLERSHSVRLPGQRKAGYDVENYFKSATTTFEDWNVAGQKNATALTTIAAAKDVLLAIPFVATSPYILDGIGFEVTTVGGVGGLARVGVYSSKLSLDGTYYPASLLIDSGQFDVHAATGVKSTANFGLALDEGVLYFAAYLCGVNAPTIRGVAVGGAYPALGLPATFGTAPQLGFTVASTYSSLGLPATFPGGATAYSTTLPVIGIRYSGTQSLATTLPVWNAPTEGFILNRVRLIPSDTFVTTGNGPSFTIEVGVRRGESLSVLGTYNSGSNQLSIGIPFPLSGKEDLIRSLRAEDSLEVRLTQTGHPNIDLSAILVQFDCAYSGG